MNSTPTLLLFAALSAMAAPLTVAVAEDCQRSEARRLVDEAGARLRVLTAETQPKLQARLRQLKEKRGWTGPESEDKVAAFVSDPRTIELDGKAAALLMRIDELSETGSGDKVDCTTISALQAATSELQATVKAKSQHVLARVDQELATGAATAAQPASSAGEPKSAATTPGPAAVTPPAKADTKAAAPSDTAKSQWPATTARKSADDRPTGTSTATRTIPAPAKPAPSPRVAAAPPVKAAPKSSGAWSTETSARPPGAGLPAASAPTPLPLPPPASTPPADAFSADEIAEASRGFFGTISSGLANVIEHAFSTLGRPSAYVLGNEGGGAFIAGVRYGKGRLFTRRGPSREVYWHGPSIGYDVGASGSKVLFLVYNLETEYDMFAGFSGVEGSAYLVGGVGMTVLTNGKMVLAPIRSGLGLRLGANIGYLRFTARPTWNPF